ncbi:3-hydroxyacyl-CoA dehydrogenase NAD-binding domain-containing protein [Streptomyces sp. NPDC057291]|uniref:3-hydroxyacyl-CoA dehydrogenase NAD-binding domain-containing protein n=1 Tax=Streptomyces sp. NPDC057291 TaxID=3346087 RepID=UPI00362BAEE1
MIAYLDRGVRNGKLSENARDAALSRLAVTSDLGEFTGCHLVIEAVAERLEAKAAIFGTLDKVLAPEAKFASNTSFLPITELAA